MIIGSGLDIIENDRVERELARADWTPSQGIFTPDEIQLCTRSKRPALLYSACFAAKEATLKALGLGIADLSIFREIELVRESDDRFGLRLHGNTDAVSRQLGISRMWIALTTTTKFSGAMVVLES